MGCVSSKSDTTLPPETANVEQPTEAQNDAKGRVSESKSVDQLPSESGSKENSKNVAEIASKAMVQRRRLSVAPQHVGDISKQTATLANRDSVDLKDGLNLRQIQAKGSVVHALRSKKGVVPYNRNKVNQDRAVIVYALADDLSLSMFCVCDGHGEFGHHVASFICEKLPLHLTNTYIQMTDNKNSDLCLKLKSSQSDVENWITLSTARMCAELSESSINVAFSGSTLVFTIKVDDKLYVANVGDSRCVMARRRKDVDGKGALVEPLALSNDHKPEVPVEKARILKCGGRVEPLPGPPGEDCGPPRVWLKEVDVPGLAMSRSVGDEVSQTVGVISVPEIIVHDLNEDEDLYAVWASDGVWEFLSNQQVIDIVFQERNNLEAATKRLVDEADRMWRSEEEVVDDITCIIVQFNPFDDPIGEPLADVAAEPAAA